MNTSRNWGWTSFGFVVLVLVFQRAYSFYSSITMDYQVILGLASVASWVVVFLLSVVRPVSIKVLFTCSIVLLAGAFCVQEAFLLLAAQGHQSIELLVSSCVLFALGYAFYCRLWMLAYERKALVRILICISATSGLSAIIACLPPLVVGLDTVGNLSAFVVRLAVLGFSFFCVHRELAKPFEWVGEEGEKPTLGEAWDVIKVVIIAVLAARFVQGLLFMDEAAYREYGAQVLLIVSPIISGLVILLAKRFGSYSGFVSAFYWLLATCSLVILLVVASVIDSSISFLWVLLFAVYAQIDVVFFGILASLRKALGSSFPGLVCALFGAKELVFVCGRVLRSHVDIQVGTFICVVVLLGTVIFGIVVYLLQSVKNTHSDDGFPPIPEALSVSLGKRYDLTPREVEVLLALLQGRSYTNIGYKLFISKSTVKTHANHIYAKLGVGSRDELIEFLNPSDLPQ